MLSSTFWGWPLVRALSPAGHAVVLLGHRQFPFASASEQVADVVAALKEVAAAAPSWGGCAGDVQLAGQSAGAHLAACAALVLAKEAAAASGGGGGSSGGGGGGGGGALAAAPPPPRLRALVLASGVYDVPTFLPLLREKGLPADLLRGLFGGDAPAQLALSPRFAVESGLARWLPPTALLHGALDTAVPSSQSEAFHAALVGAGVPTTLTVFDDLGHTAFVIEGPVIGRDELAKALAGRGAPAFSSPLFPFARPYTRLVTALNPFS